MKKGTTKKIKSGEIQSKIVGRNKDIPYILDDELTEDRKREIEKVVKKIVNEYGEALGLLGKE